MVHMFTTNVQRLLAWSVAAALAFAAALAAVGVAYAEGEGPDTTPAEPTELQQRVEDSAVAYNDAVSKVKELQARIDENSARIAQIEAELPAQQAKADAAMVAMYKMSSSGDALADILMGMEDVNDFVSALDCLSTIASALSESEDTVEDVYEPFLIQQGFIVRTPKGREATDKAFAHCGVSLPECG